MQRDYILRLIEQAGTILKHLLRTLRERSVEEAAVHADLQRAASLGGLDLDLLRVCDGAGVVQLVSPAGEIDPSRAWLAAETLYVDALAAEAGGDPDAASNRYAKAAMLFGMMAPSWVLPTGFPEATERSAEIERRLDALDGGTAPTPPS